MPLKEDPEVKCGYGWLNFNWIMKPYRQVCEWHDKVTTSGSNAEKVGISDSRIVEAWKTQINRIAASQNVFYKIVGRVSNFVIAKVNKYFYTPNERVTGEVAVSTKLANDKERAES